MKISDYIKKRILAVILTVVILVSMVNIAITSASAKSVELVTTSVSMTGGEKLYLAPGVWNSEGAWFAAYFYGTDYKWAVMEDSDNDGVYEVSAPSGSWTNVIFCRMNPASTKTSWSNKWNQTNNLTYNAEQTLYTISGWGSDKDPGTWSSYSPTSTGTYHIFADVDGDLETTYDVIEVTNGKLYLPSTDVTLFTSEGNVIINGYKVTSDGIKVNLPSGTYKLSGDSTDTIKVLRSQNASSIHTTTKKSVPQGTYKGYPYKDDFSTEGSIVVYGADGKQKNDNVTLKKIKGRGNSSWKASHQIVGKYAFNITLDKKAKLLNESAKSKKYCLVSFNADQARMRNMIIYELAQQIGSRFAPNYEPVDFYNNGQYVGSYLLTDKVEIGDPLVDILNIDDINEELNTTFDDNDNVIKEGKNYSIYDSDDISSNRKYYGGSSINDNSTKGFYKYVDLEEPDASTYAESGFLLEFELNERFANEISGFISKKGQQIVCKYPEYASKNEIKFIMDKWNAAESVMYNKNATYTQLDEVIDVESFAKMYLIQELTKNLDGGATSFYIFYDNGKFYAGVAWDFDWALGQYELSQSSKINSSSDFYSKVNANPSEYGGWYLNSKNIYGASTFNVQAALCQNDNFWSVVVAEWDEVFYSEFSKFTKSTVTSTSDLSGYISDFYNDVKYSTIMDEDKWSIIKNNPLSSWGSSNTGSSHSEAVVWLNNWIYNRVNWMDKYISTDGSGHSGVYGINYDIKQPIVTTDKEAYVSGDTVNITIKDKTSGDFKYIISDGAETITSDIGLYSFIANKSATYSVKAVSNITSKESKAVEVIIKVTEPICDHTAVSTTYGYDATCTEPGLTNGKKCNTCGAITVEQEVIPAHGHKWIDGICDNCNENCAHSYTNGICDTCGKPEPPAEPPAQVSGYTVTLSDSIGVNFYLELTDAATQDESTRVIFTLPNGSKETVSINDARVDEGYYIFSCGIAAKEMSSVISGQLFTSDSKSEVFEYTVMEYAETILNSTKPEHVKAQPLVKAMLNYGAYAQIYFEYNQDNLANEVISEEDKFIAEVDFAKYKPVITGTESGVSYYGSALSLKSDTSVKHYLYVENDAEIPVITFNEQVLNATQKGNYYVVEIPDILAQNLDNELIVNVGSITIKYNAFSYGYLVMHRSDINLKNVINALYAYNQAAKDYVKSK